MYVGHVPASIARAREESPLSTLSVPAPPPPLPLTSFCVPFKAAQTPPPFLTVRLVVIPTPHLCCRLSAIDTSNVFLSLPLFFANKSHLFFPLTTNLDNTMSSAAHEAIPAIPLKKQPQVQEDGAAAAAAGGEQGAAAAGGLGNDA